MQDYTIQDTPTASSANQHQNTHQAPQQAKATTLQQNLPQTGISSDAPQVAFGFSLGLLIGLVMLKSSFRLVGGRHG